MTTPLPATPPGAVLLTFDDVSSANRGIAAPQFNASAVVERQYLTWEAVPAEGAVELRTYKTLKSLWPLAHVDSGQTIEFSFGGVDVIGDTNFGWSDPASFDGTAATEQLDFGTEGRQLAMRVEYHGDQTFVLSGFDLDVELTGRR